MQVANALNNYIRILFNPKLESFRLFDFLIVKSAKDRYLAQIVEIYEDKFDASQNVAKLKLFYKINEFDEVLPYDNFTPNKECEIVRIKQNEIEDFTNQDKEVFNFATNAKENTPLNIQYDFFNNNSIILADKIEHAQLISHNLAKKLSNKKNVVIIDSTGVFDFEGAKKISASKNFKMPLNFHTIDFIFDTCLKDGSLEFQAIGHEIINEIKKFARSQKDSFIPFNTFVKVLLQQYKATPYPELRLLLARIKKYQMNEIFARSKKDVECLFKSIQKNPITIIDLSGVEYHWQKAYNEYIIAGITDDVYLMTRINEDNFDYDLINNIYNTKKNISFVPNVSYNYKRLPSIVQYCKNYILMPSLYQRNDFLDANFGLANLISDACIVFGEDTDNFIYMANNLEPEIEVKRKEYRKIALSVGGSDRIDDYSALAEYNEQNDVNIQQSNKAIEALNDFEYEQMRNKPEIPDEYIQTEDEFISLEEPDEAEDASEQKADDNLNISENNNDSSSEIFTNIEDEIHFENDNEVQNNEQQASDSIELDDFETLKTESDENLQENTNDALKAEDSENLDKVVELLNEEETKKSKKTTKKTAQIQQAENEENKPAKKSAKKAAKSLDDEKKENLTIEEDSAKESFEELLKEDTLKISDEENTEVTIKESNVELSDDELDFYEFSQQGNTDSAETAKKDNSNVVEEANLAEIADESIEENFKEILDSVVDDEDAAQKQAINPDLEKNTQKLPIYKEEQKQQEQGYDFKVGDSVIHPKYGKGLVVKIVQHDKRILLQIEFNELGKKLLDPKIADIKPE